MLWHTSVFALAFTSLDLTHGNQAMFQQDIPCITSATLGSSTKESVSDVYHHASTEMHKLTTEELNPLENFVTTSILCNSAMSTATDDQSANLAPGLLALSHVWSTTIDFIGATYRTLLS